MAIIIQPPRLLDAREDLALRRFGASPSLRTVRSRTQNYAYPLPKRQRHPGRVALVLTFGVSVQGAVNQPALNASDQKGSQNMAYETFQVLLDEPVVDPGMGFDDYVGALAEVILHTPPRFAVGIFGQWGSGKTTLMRATEHELRRAPTVIPVWFNAWRYEREEHLIVPMLDVVRTTLAQWAAANPAEPVVRDQKAATLVRTLAKSARALVAGLSIKAGFPGAIEASWEANKSIEQWDAHNLEEGISRSAFHASFSALERASKDFIDGGAQRFVVFVDDLDRCLPPSALQVLESMKLFFDMKGFVFVVGLDRTVIERAVQIKYPTSSDAQAPAPQTAYVSGSDYVKKIFQMQFNLPTLREGQLDEFVHRLAATVGLSAEQRKDLTATVLPHLLFLAGDGTINPREVKRLINSYVMQMKTLSRKLDRADPSVVLALQTMAFRRDWLPVYEQLESDPEQVKEMLTEAVQAADAEFRVNTASGVDLAVQLPSSLSGYLQGIGSPLLGADLTVYLSSMESTQFTDSRLPDARRALRAARQAMRGDELDQQVLSSSLAPLRSLLESYGSHPAGARALARLSGLLDAASDSANPPTAATARAALDYIDAALRELRVGTSTGAAVA